MNRGLTLIELLVALALLSSVALAAVAWTQTALRTGAASAERLRWETSALAHFALVADALACGDSPADEQPRVVAEGTATVAIRRRETSRPGQYQWHVMTFDPRSATVRLTQRVSAAQDISFAEPSYPAQSEAPARILIRHVGGCSWTLDTSRRILTIRLESTAGHTMTRSFRCP